MQLVGVACCICGSPNHREFVEVVRRMDDGSGGTYRIARCSACGFLYVNPRPTPEELIRLYSHNAMCFREDYEPVSLEMPVLRRVIREIQRFVKSGSLLEVGCGRGELLELASKSGFAAHGCDLQRSPALDSNVDFHVGTLQSSTFRDESFDCLVLRNTLEHLFDPADELRTCHRLLKPGGYLYLKVPNADYEHGWRCRMMWGGARLWTALAPQLFHSFYAGQLPGTKWVCRIRLADRIADTLSASDPQRHPANRSGRLPDRAAAHFRNPLPATPAHLCGAQDSSCLGHQFPSRPSSPIHNLPTCLSHPFVKITSSNSNVDFANADTLPEETTCNF
jgi:SAM-dependent methyltransferase